MTKITVVQAGPDETVLEWFYSQSVPRVGDIIDLDKGIGPDPRTVKAVTWKVRANEVVLIVE